MVFYWGLSDSKSPQVSRTLFSILADFNNAVVRTVSNRLVTSKSSSPFVLILGDFMKGTNYYWYSRHFHVPQFFNSQIRSRYLTFFSHCFNFTLWSAGTTKSTIQQVLSFLLIFIRSGRLAEIS